MTEGTIGVLLALADGLLLIGAILLVAGLVATVAVAARPVLLPRPLVVVGAAMSEARVRQLFGPLAPQPSRAPPPGAAGIAAVRCGTPAGQ